MDNNDRIRLAIKDILLTGNDIDSKVNSILQLAPLVQNRGIVVGWLEARVKQPKPNQYIDVMLNDRTILHERLYNEELNLRMRQENLLWKPHYIEE